MKYQQAKDLADGDFKRLFSVDRRATCNEMVGVMQQRAQTKQKPGRSSKLSLEDQGKVTRQYWRGVPHLLSHRPRLGRIRINSLPYANERNNAEALWSLQRFTGKEVSAPEF